MSGVSHSKASNFAQPSGQAYNDVELPKEHFSRHLFSFAIRSDLGKKNAAGFRLNKHERNNAVSDLQ